jgi:hypothetical protein
MTIPIPTVRHATAADFTALYGTALQRTIHAEVAELDGVVVGIAGIMYGLDRPLLFAKLLPALRPHKRFVLICARHLAKRAKEHQAVAVADPGELLSCKLLAKLGAHKIGECAEGEVYAWAKPYQR